MTNTNNNNQPMKPPTAVKWLIEHLQLDETSPHYNQHTIDRALRMENEQHMELIEKSYKRGSDDTIELMTKQVWEQINK
jgi:hypothetical protein